MTELHLQDIAIYYTPKSDPPLFTVFRYGSTPIGFVWRAESEAGTLAFVALVEDPSGPSPQANNVIEIGTYDTVHAAVADIMWWQQGRLLDRFPKPPGDVTNE